MLANKNMVSSEKLYPSSDSDRYRHIPEQWMELGDSYRRIRRNDCKLKGIGISQEDQQS